MIGRFKYRVTFRSTDIQIIFGFRVICKGFAAKMTLSMLSSIWRYARCKESW